MPLELTEGHVLAALFPHSSASLESLLPKSQRLTTDANGSHSNLELDHGPNGVACKGMAFWDVCEKAALIVLEKISKIRLLQKVWA